MFDVFKRAKKWWKTFTKPDRKARSKDWRKVRQQHLERHPVCAACGRNTSLEVHHIKPFHVHPELELEADNLITLCEEGAEGARSCHYTFGHAYHWKGYNPHVVKDAADFLKKVQFSEKLAKAPADKGLFSAW